MEKLAFSLVIGIFIGDSSKKAQALFSSLCSQRPNRSSTKEDHDQAGGRWTIDPVGNGT